MAWVSGEVRFIDMVRAGLVRCGVDFSRPLAIAVSGGPDSTSLLLACSELRSSEGLEIRAEHFDHLLRPGSSEEAEHVRGLCASLGVPFGLTRSREGAHRSRQNLEDGARRARYGALARAVRAAGCQGVATGHTMDDQSETVLLHLVRGSGMRGLAGMQPAHVMAGSGSRPALNVFRPMLWTSHAEAFEFCRSMGVTPLMDPTNLDTSRSRNLIRHRVMPELRKINPEADASIARFAELVSQDAEFLERFARLELRRFNTAGGYERKRLAALDPVIARRVLLEAYRSASGTSEGLESTHLEQMLVALRAGAGRSIDLPHGLKFRTTHGAAYLEHARGQLPFEQEPLNQVLPVPGSIEVGGGLRIVSALVRAPESNDHGPEVGWLDAAIAEGQLTVRNRRPGDRFHALGMPAEGKLQDFFVGQHVPREKRDMVPLVVTHRGIAWVAGYRIAEWAKLPQGARKSLRLKLVRIR